MFYNESVVKEVSPALKSWFELVEKGLLIISTSIIILTAAYKGADYLSSKTAQVDANKQEIVKRTAAIDLMTTTYTTLLTQLNDDIKALDDKLGDEVWKDSVGWEKFTAIRESKAKDRGILLQSLGAQVVQLKQAEK